LAADEEDAMSRANTKRLGTILLAAGTALAVAGCAGPAHDSDGRITLEEFERIDDGMTYDQVVEIIGGEGVQAGGQGAREVDGMRTPEIQIYTWDGAGWRRADATVTFQDGLVSSKAQSGLR
jgi:hypothetical protein